MKNNYKNKSSVIFIDEESLLPEEAWEEKNGRRDKTSKLRGSWNKIKSIPEDKQSASLDMVSSAMHWHFCFVNLCLTSGSYLPWSFLED
ncbi:unnamed protein product [Allacma fusca]|uniref:Uncharacterized protein n=1 Tax=Allacma fusca TaxID=39272 RepID=A0A8J2KJY8_9HEXA|nr:unnamed protein product [Allacma fusca]